MIRRRGRQGLRRAGDRLWPDRTSGFAAGAHRLGHERGDTVVMPLRMEQGREHGRLAG